MNSVVHSSTGVTAQGGACADCERLALAAKKTPVAIVMTDSDGRIEWVNDAFVATTGYSAAEVLGKTPGSVLQGAATNTETVRVLRECIVKRKEFEAEILNYRKDGRAYWAHVRADPVFDDSGRFRRYVSVHTDISARKTAERLVADQAALIDQAQDAIVVCDEEGQVRFWSKSCERLYGWDPLEAVGQRISDLVFYRPPDWDRVLTTTLANGKWVGTSSHRSRTGSPLFVQARWNLVPAAGDVPVKIIGICTDVTLQCQLEEQIARAQRLDSLGAIAGGIAHDFNNLLQPVLTGLDLLSAESAIEELAAAGVIERMQASARRAASMAKQLLQFARGEKASPRWFDISETIAELGAIAATFSPTVSFSAAVESGATRVFGDPNQIQQVLLNLCVNARDAMQNGGRIEVHVKRVVGGATVKGGGPLQQSGTRITVADTGVGMSEDVCKRVFEPFFTTKGAGSGLGLATAYNIVRNHRGTITVESTPGKGTTFAIALPDGAEDSAEMQKCAPVQRTG